MRIRSTNQRVVGSTPYGSTKTSFFSEYGWVINRVTSSFTQISYWSSYGLVGPLFLFLPHFHIICDLLLNRRKASGIVFVKGKTVAIRGQNWWPVLIEKKRKNKSHRESIQKPHNRQRNAQFRQGNNFLKSNLRWLFVPRAKCFTHSNPEWLLVSQCVETV